MKAILQGFYQKEHFWLRLGVVLLAVFGMGFLLPRYAGVVLPLRLRHDDSTRIHYLPDFVLFPLGRSDQG